MLDINNPLEINIIKQQNQNTPKKNLTSTKKNSSESNSNSIENQVKKNSSFYTTRESVKLIEIYGPELYNSAKFFEQFLPEKNFLKQHKIHSQIRNKMIDWMFEVFDAYKSETQTFFLCVHYFDLYLSLHKNILNDNNVHLLGIVCMFLASKIEDLCPFQMYHTKVKIGHGKFSEKEIKDKEKEILKIIEFKLVTATTYDFIRTYLYDLYVNNKEKIEELNVTKHLDSLENVAVFIGKMMLLSDEFSSYNHSIKAICCFILGFDILRSGSKTLNKDQTSFIREWMLFLINEGKYTQDEISYLYNKALDLYQKLEDNKQVFYSNNLKKTHELYFY